MIGIRIALALSGLSAMAGSYIADIGWLRGEADFSIGQIIQNISPADALPGAVVASQSRRDPNYYFHWVRDAGLVMEAVLARHQNSSDAQERAVLTRKFHEYLQFSERLQNVPAISGLGEPKFNVDGTAYNEPWGRPQNDGPALRALSLIHWADSLLAEGKIDFVGERLYNPSPRSVIKRDLEFVSHHWREASFDLWEEVKGDHFYTRMVQRRALVDGARLAERLGDSGAARWYLSQAREIERDLANFWDPRRGYIIATRNRVEGVDYKHSELDTAVILALLHGSTNDGFLRFSDPKVLATIQKLIDAFSELYPINFRAGVPGVGIGRYPEDKYGGADFKYGNPWPLCTLAISEALYRAAEELIVSGKREQASSLIEKADTFVGRVKYHADADGSLAEQMDRYTGFMKSAEDLTWNYAAVLTTLAARDRAVKKLGGKR